MLPTNASISIKVLGHQQWGSSTEIQTRLYQSLVKTKLDYGCIAYDNAKPSLLKLLDPIQNTVLRIGSGALRTSSIYSILEETNQLPLSIRRRQLTQCYLVSKPTHLAFKYFYAL